VFAPAGGKRLACFIDDLNMPKKSQFGFMPPLELLKLWVDNGFWYDRQKQEVKQIKDMQVGLDSPNPTQPKPICMSLVSTKCSCWSKQTLPTGHQPKKS
jgi:hypothetical protein